MNRNFSNYLDSEKYSHLNIEGTGLLSLQNAPNLISKYASGKKVLDFGCGAGRSSEFLFRNNLTVSGTDINENMLRLAKDKLPQLEFRLIKKNSIPWEDNFFDIVFSCLVFFELSSLGEMSKALNEIRRVVRSNGIVVITTGSIEMYYHEWLSIDALKFDSNKNLKSGDKAKVYLKNINLELVDYFWTKEDYLGVFKSSGFDVLKIDYPLAEGDKHSEWKSELFVSPYITFVLRPI